MRTTIYTEEFIWEEKYRGLEDLDNLVDFVSKTTQRTRRLPSQVSKQPLLQGKVHPPQQPEQTPQETGSNELSLEYRFALPL